VKAHIQCLAATGAKEETYAGILKPTLLQKLPNALVVDWHRETDHQVKDVSALLLFIRTELESREDADMLRRELRQSQQPRSASHQQSGYRHEERRGRFQNHYESNDVSGNRPSTATQLVAGPAPQYPSGQTFNNQRGRGRGSGGRGRGGFNNQQFQSAAGFSNPPPRSQQPAPQAQGQPANNPNVKYPCVYCKGHGHFPVQCSMPVGERWQLINREKRCHICLRDGHTKAECETNRRPCKHCEAPHHTSLHKDQLGGGATYTRAPHQGGPRPYTGMLTSVQLATPEEVAENILLMTATVQVTGRKKPKEGFTLFDGCSSRTFIRRSFADKMGIENLGTQSISVYSFGCSTPSPPTPRGRRKFTICGKFPGAEPIVIIAPDQDFINPAPAFLRTEFAQQLLNNGNYLADDRFFDQNPKYREVDILIGADYYWRIIGSEIIRNHDGLTAVPSKVGWLIHGPCLEADKNSTGASISMIAQSMSQPSLNQPDWKRDIQAPLPISNSELLHSMDSLYSLWMCCYVTIQLFNTII